VFVENNGINSSDALGLSIFDGIKDRIKSELSLCEDRSFDVSLQDIDLSQYFGRLKLKSECTVSLEFIDGPIDDKNTTTPFNLNPHGPSINGLTFTAGANPTAGSVMTASMNLEGGLSSNGKGIPRPWPFDESKTIPGTDKIPDGKLFIEMTSDSQHQLKKSCIKVCEKSVILKLDCNSSGEAKSNITRGGLAATAVISVPVLIKAAGALRSSGGTLDPVFAP